MILVQNKAISKNRQFACWIVFEILTYLISPLVFFNKKIPNEDTSENDFDMPIKCSISHGKDENYQKMLVAGAQLL